MYIQKPNYEEPAYREYELKEQIPRLNPIDFETYKISESSQKVLNHIDRTLSSLKSNSRLYNKEENSNSEFSVQQILKMNNNKNSITNSTQVDESTKQKATSKVMEFFNEINNGNKNPSRVNNYEHYQNQNKEEDDYEYQQDDSKWKYNKQELMERKQKLLKDKSSIGKY
jgi:hypothetical protein